MPNWVLTACLLATTFLLADRCNAQDSTFGFDLNGKPVERLEGQGTKGIVLLFLASDCAISNRYLPEIMRLQSKFAPQGIMFWLVYPNAGETPDALRHHLKTYGVECTPFWTPSTNSWRWRKQRSHRKLPSWLRPTENRAG